ncbi:transcription factor TFIIIB component B'' isoform X2 [Dioscorea cayenensis subsp. rotundata]|uniref:Transcription factor TFIIIB component B'' isoform X2 n=1 Tax=Dioscorea cayennensis subsp. rotundata TaxID=55577 RepID=A0AB40BGE2_DIOCR|nr:transcription factor TFIIIB component B'' isoform X2 [Dioscorea cayenensis subsp. rotundata]
MFGDSDCLDDLFSSTSTANDEASIKFRPKQPLKMTKVISRPSVATKPNPANLDPSIHSTDLNSGSQVSHVRQEPVFPEKASHIESQVIEIDVNLQTNPNHTEVEAAGMAFNTESFDELIPPTSSIGFTEPLIGQDHSPRSSPHREISSEFDMATADVFGIADLVDVLLQPSVFTDRQLSKFQPKRSQHSQPKAGKTKSVSFKILVESDASHQILETNGQGGESIGMGTSLAQMTDGDSVEHDPQPLSAVSTCSADIQSPHCGTGKCQNISEEPSKVIESQDAEDLIEQILNGLPAWSTAEDDGSSKSSRKLRKRTSTQSHSAEHDGRTSEDYNDDLSSVSQMDEDRSDNEYTMEDMSKQKMGSKNLKKKTSESKKPVQRNRKASAKPDSTFTRQEKHPVGTKRKRRLVDKTLLEKPENEIDPKRISIKDLILLAEAKEKISSKEATASGRSIPKQRDANYPNKDQFDVDPFGDEQEGDEDNNSHHVNSRKLNYHSYLNKSQSTRWSKLETDLFYQGVRQFGTDFAMIKQLFPNRTRHQVKLKFKNEERKKPLQIADALLHRSKDNSHFELVIQQLQAQSKQGKEDESHEPSVASEDKCGDEDTNQEVNKFDDELEGSFDWDDNASYSPGKVKDILGDLFS